MDYQEKEELLKKIEAYKTICEDLIAENKSLKEKIKELENNTTMC